MLPHLWHPRTLDHCLTGGLHTHTYIHLHRVHEYTSDFPSIYLCITTITQKTPLHVAIWDGTPPIARTLLEHGADPNVPDNLGTTALHAAIHRGWEVVTFVEVLLEYGANVDARDKKGWTPLHGAAYHLNLEVVVVLLNHGTDPRAQTNKGETPIQLANAPHHRALRGDQAQVIQLLSPYTRERMWCLGSWD